MHTEEIQKIYSDIGKLLPDLFAVFELPARTLVYLNPSGLAKLDPSGTFGQQTLHLTDFIGMEDADRFEREVHLQLRVRGVWNGQLALRDLLGSEFKTQIKLHEIPRSAGQPARLFLYANLPQPQIGQLESSVTDEDMLHALLDSTPSSVYFKDLASRYLRISRNKAEKHGLADARDSIGKTDFDYFTVEHASPAYEDEQRIIKTGVPIIDYEEKETFPDGSVRWVSSTKLPFHNRAGKLVGTYGISRDVTTQKLAEERLRMLYRAVEQSHSSIVITDTKGNIQYVNPCFEKTTGYTVTEVMGQNPRLLKSGKHPPQYYSEMWDTVSNGREWSGELQNRRKNGEIYWEQATISAIRDENGQFTHYLAVKEDVTARKLVEQDLREREALFSAVFNGTIDAVLLYAENRIIDCNNKAPELFACTKENLVGTSPVDYSPAKQADGRSSEEAARIYVDNAIANGSCKFEWLHKRANNEVFPTEVTLSAFEFQGRPVIHGAIRDLTLQKNAERERRELESRLQLSSKLESVGSLAAGVAHEVNTPTQFISDNVRFLKDSFLQLANVIAAYRGLVPETPEYAELRAALDAVEQENELGYLLDEVPRCIEQSLDGLRRIAKIVGSLKEFSHPGGEAKSHADLNRAIETTIAVSRHEWKYVADLVTELDPDLPPVNCVIDEINQVVLNLVVNAAHAIEDALKKRGEKRGQITIRTRKVEGEAIVEVQDTGSGIPEAVRDKIFEPFFTTKSVGKGTGQGLAIVQSIIVKKHHGSIGFSTEMGKGTTFRIAIPITPLRTAPPLSTKPSST